MYKVVCYASFLRLKNGPVSEKAKKTDSYASKVEQSHHIFFQLLLDTATLSILKLRMLKARGFKG